MIKIEDKTRLHYKKLVEDSLKTIFLILPKEDLEGIDKVLLLDKCQDKDFEWSGGFYRSAKNGNLAYIELYPEKILKGIPFFLPRLHFFKRYSIVRMFLHELGHHNSWDQNDLSTIEPMADKYMFLYLKKIYGIWNSFFYFFGFLDTVLKNCNYSQPN